MLCGYYLKHVGVQARVPVRGDYGDLRGLRRVGGQAGGRFRSLWLVIRVARRYRVVFSASHAQILCSRIERK